MSHWVVPMATKCRSCAGLAVQTFLTQLSWAEDRMGVRRRAGSRQVVGPIPPVLGHCGGLWETCAKNWLIPYNHMFINTLRGWPCSEKLAPAAARRGKLDRIVAQALTCTTLQQPEKLAGDWNRTVTIAASASR